MNKEGNINVFRPLYLMPFTRKLKIVDRLRQVFWLTPLFKAFPCLYLDAVACSLN